MKAAIMHHAVAALLLAATAPPVAAQTQDAKAGETLFSRYGCMQCHNNTGQGGQAGPKLAPEVIPYESFAAIVRAPAPRMPAYPREALSDADLGRIHAYLQAMPAPADPATIPLLRERQAAASRR